MRIKLSALAEKLGLDHTGDDIEITGVNTLDKAGPEEISFLVNPKYAAELKITRAGCVLTSAAHAGQVGRALVSANVYMDLARIVHIFARPQGCLTGVSELAYVHPSARLEADVTVYPFAFIGEGAVIGAGTTVFAGCYIGERTRVGTGCILYPNAVVMGGLTLGNNVILQPGVVLGGDGYGYAQTPAGHMKIPQIGTVIVEDDVEIGANSAIDRAALDRTRIGRGTKIDNLVQIGHNVQVGERCLLIGQVGIGGSSKIGDNVILAGQVGVADNVHIGDGAMVAAQSGIPSDVPAGSRMAGSPVMPAGTFMKAMGVCVPKLPDLLKRVKRLEKELEALKRDAGKGEE